MAIGFSEIGAFKGINGGSNVISNPTSIQFGPDGRLYVSEQNGSINAFEVQVDTNGQYIATTHEELLLSNGGGVVKSIMNHNDNGVKEPLLTNRQVTGIVVTGNAENPVLYISSSDPRIAKNNDSNLDTNSGVLTKVTWNGANWEAVDLIRGLPRSEENHSVNGMVLSEDETKLYLAVGGNTNNGAPSQFFTYTGEYALSGTVLEIDLEDLESRTVLTDDDGGKTPDGSGSVKTVARDYVYDIPTLDDPNIENITDGVGEDANGLDEDGPFGGNDGLNMAILPADAPFRIYADGFRNNYDLIFRENGQLLTVDNGSNSNLGGNPLDVNGNPTDESGLPPTNSPNDSGIGDPEPLFLIEDGGNYGHPAPARSNQDLAWTAFDNDANPDPNLLVNSVPDLSARVPLGVNIQDGFIIDPSKFTDDPVRLQESGERVAFGSDESSAIVTIGSSSNGLTEYTSTVFDGALKGALLVAQFNNTVTLLNLNDAGTALEPLIDPGNDGQLGTADDETIDADGVYPLLGGFSTPLDVIEGPNGTIWVAEIGGDFIKVFAPTGSTPDDDDFDDDGILNVEDPFIRDATNGGSVVINPGEQLLWDFDANQDNNLPGPDGYGGGLTGVMIDGETDFEAFFQEPSSLEGQNIKLDNVKFITAAGGGTTVVENVSNGDTFETFNNGEYLFHTGLTVSPFVDTLNVQWDLINPSISFTGPFQQIGSYLGTGDQSNYLKLATSQDEKGEIQVLLEDNDEIVFESFIQADDLFTVPADQNPNLSFALEIDLIGNQATPTITYDTTSTSDGINTIIGDSIDLAGTTVLDAIEGNYQVQNQASGLALGLFSTNRGQDPADTFQAVFSDITVEATGQEADLELAKTVNNNSPNIGDQVTFTLTVNNIGPDEATSVSVIDALPEGFDYISDTGNGTYNPNTGMWDIGSVPNGDSATLDITANVVEALGSSVLYRVNAGGPLIKATDGNLDWSQDLKSDNSPFLSNNGSNSTFGTNSAIAFNSSVPVGTPEAIFQQERWDNGSPNDGDEIQWAFDVDPGSEVEVRLYFAEIFSGITSADKRVFDVAVEGIVPSTFDNIDPYAIAGLNTGFVLSDSFTIDDGTLNLEFVHNTENPAIKGIEILTAGTNLDSDAYINSAEISNFDQFDSDFTNNKASVAAAPGNDSATPTVFIVGGPYTVTENNSVQVSLLADVTVPSNETIEVTFQIVPGTATPQEDYTYQSTTANFDEQTGVYTDTVLIAGSSSDATFFIDALQDTFLETNETFTVDITDVSPNAEIGTTSSTSVTIKDNESTNETVLYRVNAGGPEIAAIDDGIPWTTDTTTNNSAFLAEAGSNNTASFSVVEPGPTVVNTTPGAIFDTERWDNATAPEMSWEFAVPTAGSYEVRLFMGNGYNGTNQPGERIFDVELEGSIPSNLDNLDLSGQFGDEVGVMISNPVNVTDGTLNIKFLHGAANNPLINGIEILQLETTGNTPPGAVSDNFITNEDTLLTSNVLVDNGNGADSDTDGNPLTVSAVNGNATNVGTEISLTSGALLTLNSDGNFSYNPNGQFEGLNDGETASDSFTYTISDNNGGADTATVNVTIDGVTDDIPSDDTPSGNVVVAINTGGDSLTQDGIDFIADDFFLNGETFTDNSGGNGPQPVFDGTIYETERYGNSINYEIPVNPGNYVVELYFAEIFRNNQGNRVFDVTVEGELVLDNLDILAETDGDINQPFIFQVPNTISPETFGATNAIDIDFSAAVDNAKISGIVVRSVNETSSNTPPVAVNDNVSTNEDTLLTSNVLVDNGNGADSDADSDPLMVTEVNGNSTDVGNQIALTSGALLTLNSDGSFSYNPNGQFEGLNDGETASDSFTYTISDNNGGADTATVNVTIDGVTDDIPSDDTPSGNVVVAINTGGDSLTQDGIDFIADDFFLNGETFTDNSGGNGPQPVFDGTIYETERYGNSINYEIPVNPGNYVVELYFAEIFRNNQGNRVFDVTVEGELVLDNLDILAETDGDINQPFIFQVPNTISPETFGATNAIDIDFSAAVDNAKISGIVVRSVNETSSNTPPVAVNDNVSTNEDTLLTSNVLVDNGNGADSDADSDPLMVTEVNGNSTDVGNQIALTSGALLTLNSDGSFSYDPNGQFEGLNDGETASDSFSYTISDGNGGTDSATATITIEGVTDDTTSENVGEATLSINLNSNNIQISNFGNNSFQLTNTGDKNINQVEIDVTNALFPDSVFDPFGLAGDTTSKALTINSSGNTGIVDPNNETYIGSGGTDGYNGIRLFFDESTDNGFNPGETLGFAIDMDPNSIAGSDKTEIDNASDPSWDVGGVSGAELINSTFTVTFTDGSTASGQLQGVGNQGGSQGLASQDSPNSTVSLTVNDLNAGGVGTYDETGPSIIVNGTEGDTARVVLSKGFIQPNPRNENYNSLSDPLKAQLEALGQEDFPANNAAEFQTVDIVLNGEAQDISDQFDFSGIPNYSFTGEDQLPLGFVASIINPDNNDLPLGPTTDPIYLTFEETLA